MLMNLDPFLLKRFYHLLGMTEFGPLGETGFQDPEHCKKVYVTMHEQVRNMAPTENLLDFQLKQGWGPLCKFLGQDIPAAPFPRINESAEFGERMWLIRKHIIMRITKRLFPSFVLLILLAAKVIS
jgi:hypothetical protein